jgi:hypothetical protein
VDHPGGWGARGHPGFKVDLRQDFLSPGWNRVRFEQSRSIVSEADFLSVRDPCGGLGHACGRLLTVDKHEFALGMTRILAGTFVIVIVVVAFRAPIAGKIGSVTKVAVGGFAAEFS